MIGTCNISSKWKKITVQVIALLFIILFTYGAATKLLHFEEFYLQIEQSPFIAAFAGWLVWIIPAVLILISFLFFTSRHKLTALYASFFLMLLFSVYIYSVTNFAKSIPCSCGGIIPSLSWTQHLHLNLFFTFLAGIGIALSYSKEKIRSTFFPYIKFK